MWVVQINISLARQDRAVNLKASIMLVGSCTKCLLALRGSEYINTALPRHVFSDEVLALLQIENRAKMI